MWPKAIAEAQGAKVSVSLALMIALAYGAYQLGLSRNEDSIKALRAEISELRREQEKCAQQSRMEEILLNHGRDITANQGALTRINGDVQVVLSYVKERRRK